MDDGSSTDVPDPKPPDVDLNRLLREHYFIDGARHQEGPLRVDGEYALVVFRCSILELNVLAYIGLQPATL